MYRVTLLRHHEPMAGNQGRRVTGTAALLLLAVVIFAVALVLASQGLDRATQWVGLLGGVVALAGVAERPVRALVRMARHGGTPSQRALSDEVEDLADKLSDKWVREDGNPHERDPRSVFPLHWSVTPRAQDVMTWDTWEDLLDRGDGRGAGEPAPVPAGEYEALRETYTRRLRHRRLIVLGRGGGGKTHLARRLARDLLDSREPGDLVPVFYSLDSWDPADDLRDWLAARLVQDFPSLDVPYGDPVVGRPPETLAARLARSGRLLLVLDGFDEIAHESRHDAMDKLVRFGAQVPLIATSRTDEYQQAVHAYGRGLPLAAALELSAVENSAVKAYLAFNTAHIPPDRWNEVFALLDRTHSSPVADVLQVPLMVWLARNVYNSSGSRPAELADPTLFGRPENVENHLLDKLVDVSFTQETTHSGPQTVYRARRWLRFLARWLEREERRDIAWWRLPDAITSTTGQLMTGLPVGLAAGLPGGYVITALWGWRAGVGCAVALTVLGCVRANARALRPLGDRVPGPIAGRAVALVTGLGTGMPTVVGGELARGVAQGTSTGILAGLAAGFLLHEGRAQPTAVKVVIRGKRLLILRNVSVGLLIGLLFGAALGLLLGVVSGFATGLVFAVLALAMGLALGVVDSLHLWLDNKANLHQSVSARSVLAADRTAALARAVVAGPLVAIGTWLTVAFGFGAETGTAVATAMAFGFVLTDRMVGVTATCWGRFVLARAWLAVSRQVPWHFMGFLDDAHRRGLLRRSGPVHEFRHIRLQQRLANPAATPEPATSPGTGAP